MNHGPQFYRVAEHDFELSSVGERECTFAVVTGIIRLCKAEASLKNHTYGVICVCM